MKFLRYLHESVALNKVQAMGRCFRVELWLAINFRQILRIGRPNDGRSGHGKETGKLRSREHLEVHISRHVMKKSCRSFLFLNIFLPSIPRPMTWCKIPGACPQCFARPPSDSPQAIAGRATRVSEFFCIPDFGNRNSETGGPVPSKALIGLIEIPMIPGTKPPVKYVSLSLSRISRGRPQPSWVVWGRTKITI